MDLTQETIESNQRLFRTLSRMNVTLDDSSLKITECDPRDRVFEISKEPYIGILREKIILSEVLTQGYTLLGSIDEQDPDYESKFLELNRRFPNQIHMLPSQELMGGNNFSPREDYFFVKKRKIFDLWN